MSTCPEDRTGSTGAAVFDQQEAGAHTKDVLIDRRVHSALSPLMFCDRK